MSYVKITNFAIKDSTNDIIRGTEHDDEYNAIEASFTAQPSATQTLTNKTIALGSNTVSGTFAQLNTAITDADLARTDAANSFSGTQTFVDITTTGITFPATQSASTDANTLDDYEEGTWTASYGGQTNTGTYTKIGRVVSIEVILNKAATFSGITGLPFSCAGVTPASKSRGNGSDTNINTFSMGASGTTLDFYTNTGASQTIITTGTVRIDIQCTYQI